MRQTFPEVDGNVEIVALPTIAMFRFETIFDTLSEEPNTMSLTEKTSGSSVLLESIFRLRIWRQKGFTISLSLYADDREAPGHMVLRSVSWDMDRDIRDIVSAESRAQILNSWPGLEIRNMALQAQERQRVFSVLQRLDLHISGGITFDEADTPLFEWRDMELMRRYDWGQVHAVWNPTRRNTVVEEQVNSLLELLSDLERETGSIGEYELKLNYRADWEKIFGFSKNKRVYGEGL